MNCNHHCTINVLPSYLSSLTFGVDAKEEAAGATAGVVTVVTAGASTCTCLEVSGLVSRWYTCCLRRPISSSWASSCSLSRSWLCSRRLCSKSLYCSRASMALSFSCSWRRSSITCKALLSSPCPSISGCRHFRFLLTRHNTLICLAFTESKWSRVSSWLIGLECSTSLRKCILQHRNFWVSWYRLFFSD